MVTQIMFEGAAWFDARYFYEGADFAEWIKRCVKRFGFAEGVDFIPVDYDEYGRLIRAAGTEYLFSAKAGALVLSQKS